jgi:RNA polymerase sigma-70 factor (ECF subfamily)
LRLVEGREGGATATPTPTPSVAAPVDPAPEGWVDAPASRRGARLPEALTNLPDAQLVALGAKGDNAAFEILYRRHATFAIHLATRIEGAARDVEDIVHDAFLRAFERLGDLTDRNAFRAWLGAIVVHKVRSRMRRARLMNLLGIGRASEPVDLDAVASPDASPHVRAQIAQIYALLRTLPTDDRIAWTLRAVEGHDLETVARLTDCSLATVKRRISRAQKFLDEHFVSQEASDAPTPEDSAVSKEPSS